MNDMILKFIIQCSRVYEMSSRIDSWIVCRDWILFFEIIQIVCIRYDKLRELSQKLLPSNALIQFEYNWWVDLWWQELYHIHSFWERDLWSSLQCQRIIHEILIENIKNQLWPDCWLYCEGIESKKWYICEYFCWGQVKSIFLIKFDMFSLHRNDSYCRDTDVIIIRGLIWSWECKDDHHEDRWSHSRGSCRMDIVQNSQL